MNSLKEEFCSEFLCWQVFGAKRTRVTDRTTEGTLIVLAPEVPLRGCSGRGWRRGKGLILTGLRAVRSSWLSFRRWWEPWKMLTPIQDTPLKSAPPGFPLIHPVLRDPVPTDLYIFSHVCTLGKGLERINLPFVCLLLPPTPGYYKLHE